MVIQAGAGLSLRSEPGEAAQEAVRSSGFLPGNPVRLALALVSPHFSPSLGAVCAEVSRVMNGPAVVGGVAGTGVIASGREVESDPAVAVLWMAGDHFQVHAAHLPVGPDGPEALGLALARELPRVADPRAVLLFVSPEAGVPDPILRGLAGGGLEGVPCFGAGTTGGDPGGARTCLGGGALEDGALALLLSGPIRVSHGFSQAMGAVGVTHVVTAGAGPVLAQLSGRQALEVMVQELGETLWEQVQEREVPVFLGITPDVRPGPLQRGRFLVRNILAANRRDGSLTVAGQVRIGERVGFVVRNSLSAREELRGMLERMYPRGSHGDAGTLPDAGLYFNCCARGEGLHGVGDIDISYIGTHLPHTPVAGLFGSYELCPVDRSNEVHAYTGVLVTFSEPRT